VPKLVEFIFTGVVPMAWDYRHEG